MDYRHKLIKFFLRYNLKDNVMDWAGLLRFLGNNGKSFSLNEWNQYANAKSSIHPDVIRSFFRILNDEQKIIYDNEIIVVTDELSLQRDLEIVHYNLTIFSEIDQSQITKLLWSVPRNFDIPWNIAEQFEHLNSYIQQLIQNTNKRLIFFAPYYSEAGLKHYSISLQTLLNTKKDLKIDWIFGELKNEENENAINFLKEKLKLFDFRYLFGDPVAKIIDPFVTRNVVNVRFFKPLNYF